MDRSNWDKIVSGAGAVVAVVLIALGAMAIYGGNFGQQKRAGPVGAAEHLVPTGRGDDA
jgi:hypothetical protein